MSWLYTLVFSGLLLSSQGNPLNYAVDRVPENVSAVRSAQGDETERFEHTYPLTANGRVSLSNVNGSIIINAWDRDEVKLVAVKTAESKERLAEVEIKVDASPDSISIESDYGDWKVRNNGRNGKLEVNYELSVPRGAALNEVETVNGSVTVADLSNFTKVSAVNGNIKASNLKGTADLSTVNGEVFADFDRLETGSKVNLETVNGKVSLSIPSDSNATLRAESVNGVISNDFGLPIKKGQYVGRDLYGRLGAGEVQVKLSSVNGPLTIARNKDGRSASPATNLLQQKAKDDDMDEDDNSSDDDSVIVDSVKINKDVAKALKESQRVSKKAIKDAQKALNVEIPEVKIDTKALENAVKAIDVANIQVQIDASLKAQSEVLARMNDIRFSGMPRIESKSNSIPVNGTPTVSVYAPNCSVRVRGWDKQEVQYNVSKISDSRDRSPVPVTEDRSDSGVTIRVGSTPGTEGDLDRVRVEVFVPKRSNLKIEARGEIRLDGVSGEINLSGNEESVDVRDSDGKMTVSTASGQVRVIGFHGDLDATTTEGDLYLEGDFNDLSANAAEGNVVLTLPRSANASISSNTDVEVHGIDLTKDDAVWRIGTGEKKYNFSFTDGHLIVRNASEISEN